MAVCGCRSPGQGSACAQQLGARNVGTWLGTASLPATGPVPAGSLSRCRRVRLPAPWSSCSAVRLSDRGRELPLLLDAGGLGHGAGGHLADPGSHPSHDVRTGSVPRVAVWAGLRRGPRAGPGRSPPRPAGRPGIGSALSRPRSASYRQPGGRQDRQRCTRRWRLSEASPRTRCAEGSCPRWRVLLARPIRPIGPCGEPGHG